MAIHYALAASAVREKSITFDEPVHAAAGASFWMTGDYRLNPSSGYIPMRVEGLAIWMTAKTLPSVKGHFWDRSLVGGVAYDWYQSLGDKYQDTMYPGRLAAGLFSVLLGLVIVIWSRKLFGDAGALVSLVLFTFCPSTLANSALMTSDSAGALFFLLSILAIWRVLHQVTPINLMFVGTCLAGLILCKFSGVLILPVALVLIAIRLLSPKAIQVGLRGRSLHSVNGRAGMFGVIAIACGLATLWVLGGIWAAYGFRYAVQSPGQTRIVQMESTWDAFISSDSVPARVIRLISPWHLFPDIFLRFLASNLQATQSRMSFFNGEYSMLGWPTYFLYSIVVKTPLSTMAIVGLAFAAFVSHCLNRTQAGKRDPSLLWVYRTAPLWVFIFVYLAAAVSSHLNIDHRHILPIYAPMYVLCGVAGWWFRGRSRWPSMVVASLLLLLAVETLFVWPNYIPYFNQVVGGSKNGYRHLVDSSLDWGQDIPALRSWLEGNGLNGSVDLSSPTPIPNTKDPKIPVYLSYFGSVDPSVYGVHANILHSYSFFIPTHHFLPLRGGVYCVSATMLQNVYNQFPGHWNSEYEQAYQQLTQITSPYLNAPPGSEERRKLVEARGEPFWAEAMLRLDDIRFARLTSYLRNREPDHMINASILIYRLTDQQVRDALLGPPVELDDANLTE